MKLVNVVIGVIVVSMIVLGTTTYLSALGTEYNTNVDLSGLNKSNERLEKQQNLSLKLSDDISGIKVDSLGEAFEVPYELIQVGVGGIRLIFNGWSTIGTMLNETGTVAAEEGIALPVWLIPSIISIIVITLVIIVIYAFMKWKFED